MNGGKKKEMNKNFHPYPLAAAHFVTWVLLLSIAACCCCCCEGFVFSTHHHRRQERRHHHQGSSVVAASSSCCSGKPFLFRSSFTTRKNTAIFAGAVESSSSSSPSSAETSLQRRNENGNVGPATALLLLDELGRCKDQATSYADQFDLTTAEAALYALLMAMRRCNVPLGLHGTPFVLRHEDTTRAFLFGGDGDDQSSSPSSSTTMTTGWPGFFTMDHLQTAVVEDFLDAARGSTDNRKGWQVRGARETKKLMMKKKSSRRDLYFAVFGSSTNACLFLHSSSLL
jgi:hypothetical protein